jgi:predicted phage terminase large subunit-like protein
MIQRQAEDQEQALTTLLDVCRKSLRHFAYFVVGRFTDWQQVKTETDSDGNIVPSVYEENWHLLSWYWLMENCPRLCVLCARGFRKTGTFSWVYPLWRLWRDEGVEGLLCSNTMDQVAENLDTVKKIIEANGVLRSLKPARPVRWGAESIECANGSSLNIRGQGSATRGLHPNFCVLDDILDEKNCNTPELRAKVVRWISATIEPMLLGAAQLFIVGTPQAYDDPVMKLKENPSFVWARYPAEMTRGEFADLRSRLAGFAGITESGEGENILLWPGKFGHDWLKQRKSSVGSYTYSQEYLCNPLPEDSQVFQRGWLRHYKPEHLSGDGRAVQLPEDEQPAPIRAVFMGVDLAISEKQKADYFACVTVGCTTNRIFVLDAYHGKMSFKKQADFLSERYERFKPDVIAIESNAYQSAMRQYLLQDSLMPVKGFFTTRDKVTRARRLSLNFENGQVYIREDQHDLIAELLQFPVGAHDDLVDALGFAVAQYQGRASTATKTSRVNR